MLAKLFCDQIYATNIDVHPYDYFFLFNTLLNNLKCCKICKVTYYLVPFINIHLNYVKLCSLSIILFYKVFNLFISY